MTGIDTESVRQALTDVRERIAAAGGDDSIDVLAVTKGFGVEAIAAAVACGCRAIGENYAQELVAKLGGPGDAAMPIEIHFIGQLQTNKVRQIAGVVDVYETVDRARLADEIERRAPGARVLLQVDTSGESGKGGCPVDELDDLVAHVGALDLDLVGLMTVGPTDGGPEASRAGFRRVRAEVDRLGLAVCSMGMSDDLAVAVEEGTTQVRVGSALFGRRPTHG